MTLSPWSRRLHHDGPLPVCARLSYLCCEAFSVDLHIVCNTVALSHNWIVIIIGYLQQVHLFDTDRNLWHQHVTLICALLLCLSEDVNPREIELRAESSFTYCYMYESARVVLNLDKILSLAYNRSNVVRHWEHDILEWPNQHIMVRSHFFWIYLSDSVLDNELDFGYRYLKWKAFRWGLRIWDSGLDRVDFWIIRKS